MSERKAVEKKPYEKPAIHRVELHPEESLAAGCKSASLAGPVASNCNVPQCFVDGS